MALNQERLAGPTTLGTTANATTIPAEGSYSYQVPASTTTIVKQMLITNMSSDVRFFTIWLKPSATAYASMGNGNILWYDVSISPSTTMTINLSLVMDAGDRLYARASAASSVNVTISGIEEI